MQGRYASLIKVVFEFESKDLEIRKVERAKFEEDFSLTKWRNLMKLPIYDTTYCFSPSSS